VAARDRLRRMNLAVVPSAKSSSPSSNAWPAPSAPTSVMPRVEFDLTPRISQRAEQRPCLRQSSAPHSPEASGSAFPIKSGSDFRFSRTLDDRCRGLVDRTLLRAGHCDDGVGITAGWGQPTASRGSSRVSASGIIERAEEPDFQIGTTILLVCAKLRRAPGRNDTERLELG
jgi:hypothetical protein